MLLKFISFGAGISGQDKVFHVREINIYIVSLSLHSSTHFVLHRCKQSFSHRYGCFAIHNFQTIDLCKCENIFPKGTRIKLDLKSHSFRNLCMAFSKKKLNVKKCNKNRQKDYEKCSWEKVFVQLFTFYHIVMLTFEILNDAEGKTTHDRRKYFCDFACFFCIPGMRKKERKISHFVNVIYVVLNHCKLFSF